jgi:hypothetical protein
MSPHFLFKAEYNPQQIAAENDMAKGNGSTEPPEAVIPKTLLGRISSAKPITTKIVPSKSFKGPKGSRRSTRVNRRVKVGHK